MHFRKKAAVSFVTATLLLTNLHVMDFNNLEKNWVYAEENGKADAVSNTSAHTFKDEDKVKIIVSLKEDKVDPNSLKTEEGRKEREKSTKEPRERALKEIKDKGIDYKVLFEYDTLLNGFSLETTYADAKKIQAMDFVNSVEVSVDYEVPETTTKNNEDDTALKNTVIDSNRIIGVQGLWDKGYKGQGRVVAVIDSGLDPNHDILHLTDTSKAKYKNKAELEAVKEKAGIDYGKWYSDKLIYAFNYYDWDNNLKEKKDKSHGMHVVGTSVGNPTKKAPNNEYVAGVAPESQLIFMRVFSDKQGGAKTSTFLYVKAIEDAVKLGADSINMSLGATAGAVTEVGQGTIDAIALAKKAGVNVVVAAGNDNVFGNGQSKPSASNPDYGLIGTPSVTPDSIAVAAINNSVMNTEVMTVVGLEGNEEWDNGEATIRPFAKRFDPKTEYSYFNAGYGLENDFKNQDVKGKIAVMMRGGGNTFADKVAAAKKAGAAGAVLYNTKEGGEELLNVALNNYDSDFPVVFVGYKFGNLLATYPDYYKLKFTGHFSKRPHPQANQLADFTSWGVTGDGLFKPDVTAPGGDVYSSFNNGTYGLDSGTSMASPHVAGAISLMKQVFQERYPDLQGEELQKLIKHLLMSTAIPNYNNETKAFTSPRQQGAGVIDVSKAAFGDLYVTGDNDYGSISLGNVQDTFKFNVVLHNLSDQPKELVYKSYLNTDGVENGQITLKPRQLSESNGGETVVVPAKGEKSVTITVDATQFRNELEGQMPNGYYLEGFVRFFDPKDTNTAVAGIPYVGFKGEFQNLPVVEKPIYEFKGNEKPFYYYKPNTTERDDKNNFTSLVTVDVNGEEKHIKVLGEYTNPKSKSNYFGKLAFSPNGDRQHDEIGFKATFLRNYENLKLSVYAKDDVERKNPLYENGNVSGKKNFFHNKATNKKAVLVTETNWKGQDNNGNPLPDGEYQYVVSYSPVATGAKMQETVFNVTIDRVAPQIVGTGGVYDEKTRTFKPYAVKENGSGVLYKKLSYKVTKKGKDGKTVEKEVEVEPNIDGTFTLPEKVSLDKFTYEVSDFAGNKDSVGISKVQNTEKGTVEVKTTAKDGTGDYSTNVRYAIKNEKGELVGEDFTKNGKNLTALPYGKYTVQVVLTDEALKLTSPKEVAFEITKDDSTKSVEFTFEEQKRNTTIIKFDKVIPAGAKVFVTNEQGEKTELSRSLYSEKEFQKRLNNGKYTVEVVLPEGYRSSENNFKLVVGNGRNTKELQLSLAQKVASVTTAEGATTPATVEFGEAKLYNDYKLVVGDVEKASKEKILKQLTDSEIDLTKYDVVFYDIHLEDRNNKVVEVDGTRKVTLSLDKMPAKFGQEKKDGTIEPVNGEVVDGKFVFTVDELSNFVALVEKNAPKEDVKVDKSQLKLASDNFKVTTDSDKYEYASLDAKEAYNKAINKAKQLLEDEHATQDEVNKAVEELNVAISKLTGVKPKEAKGEPEKVEAPKEYTGVQAGAIVEPEKVEPPKEYTGVQAGAVVEPEKVEGPKEYTGVQAGAVVEPEKVEGPKEYTGVQAGAIVEPEKVEAPKEYTGVQAGAVVDPAKAEAPKEYTGVQAGAVVEPEKVEAPKEYTGKVEQPKVEAPSIDKKELAAEVEKNGDLTSQDSFKEAEEAVKKEYKAALKAAILVLSNANAKQDEVNNALEILKKASEKVSKGKSKLSTLLGDVFKKDKDKASVGLADVAKDQGMVANNSQVNLGNVGKSNSLLAKTGTLALPTTFVGLALICLVYVLRRRKNTK